jgi:SAM-dependent methyltransferase
VELVGIVPSGTTANRVRRGSVRVLEGPLGLHQAQTLVDEGWQADLVIANQAIAHVDDPIDLLRSIRAVLAPGGRLAIETHHVLGIVRDGQFDVVSPAHAVYPALADVLAWLSQMGLDVVQVALEPAYGGSLRLLATAGAAATPVSAAAIDRGIGAILSGEMAACVGSLRALQEIGQQAKRAASELRSFLVARRAEGARVVGYGAPARAGLLLNLAGIDESLLPYTVDENPGKHGRVFAGNRIPVRDPKLLESDRPDYVLVLPWTLLDEISLQLTRLRQAGTRLVVAVPSLQVMD